MSEPKYKVGDKVKIKSLDWYNKNKGPDGAVHIRGEYADYNFTIEDTKWCGMTMTIIDTADHGHSYIMKEDEYGYYMCDEMIEGFVKNETPLYKAVVDKNGNMTGEFVRLKYVKQEINLPEGYIFKDENGNMINTTKIVLEKKKKEYPKTYEECCKILNYQPDEYDEDEILIYGYMADELRIFQKLLVCRDAYWKLYGEEMGLGKPWDPEFDDLSTNLECFTCLSRVFAFPTKEMCDTFKKNFDPDIKNCKKLL